MILVDPLFKPVILPKTPKVFHGGSCHMVSDVSHDELHEFALRVGLRRSWFQGDHYDLTPSRREVAVLLGAVEVRASELVRRRVRKDGTRRDSPMGEVKV